MNFKELVSAVAADTKLPPGQVRKICLAIFNEFARLIENQDNFSSPVIKLRSKTQPATGGNDGKTAKPKRKFASMKIRAKKSA
jgi:hypothetical protein